MKKIGLFNILIGSLLLLTGCAKEQNSQAENAKNSIAQFTSFESTETSSDDFQRYWYKGEAEISSYKLEQARYGEIHEGHSVLVYVTEDFSKSKQVKLDNAGAAGADRVPVLKLNLTKKFNTGIYPYSIMQSIFTPVDLAENPYTLKTTMSSQEWCGHVFTQLNEGKDSYDVSGYSYFESEGDTKEKLKKAMMEDELWTRIRINPQALPTGQQELIPSVIYSRLKHKPLKAEKATLSLKENGSEISYSISYNSGRSLKINFEKAFPHKILSWEEKYKDGWGPGAAALTTKATLMKSLNTDYWSRNGTRDLPLRDELRLP